MKKYRLKSEYKYLFKELKINEFAKKIGISRQTLSYIINQRSNCSYPVAFTITKKINSNLGVESIFEEI